jgi:hypothetical protein
MRKDDAEVGDMRGRCKYLAVRCRAVIGGRIEVYRIDMLYKVPCGCKGFMRLGWRDELRGLGSGMRTYHC